jgi:hypothetical protein
MREGNMKKIEFKNGSIMEALDSASNCRGSRSKLISFYCYNCGCVHVDYPIKNMMIISDNLQMCKESFEKVIKPLINNEEDK